MLTLITAIWIRSCFAQDFFVLGWSPRGRPDRIVVPSMGWPRGCVMLTWYDMPKVYVDFLRSSTRGLYQFSGLHWMNLRTNGPWRRRELWFHSNRFKDAIPINPDGTVAIGIARAGKTPPARTLPLTGGAITIPLWVPMLLFGAMPLWRLVNLPARRRRSRIAAGRCAACGYDLRATPDRCPECGALPEKIEDAATTFQTFLRILLRLGVARAFSFVLVVALALAGSAVICQRLYFDATGLRPLLMQGWTISNRIVALFALEALAVVCSCVISLLILDAMRKLLRDRIKF